MWASVKVGFLRLRESTRKIIIDQKRLQEKKNIDVEGTKTRRSSKKRQTEATKNPRGRRPTADQRFGIDFEVQKEAQDPLTSTLKEAKRAPKRSQDHHRLPNADVENMQVYRK